MVDFDLWVVVLLKWKFLQCIDNWVQVVRTQNHFCKFIARVNIQSNSREIVIIIPDKNCNKPVYDGPMRLLYIDTDWGAYLLINFLLVSMKSFTVNSFLFIISQIRWKKHFKCILNFQKHLKEQFKCWWIYFY